MRNLNSARSPSSNYKVSSMFEEFQDIKLIKTEGQPQRIIKELIHTNQPLKMIKLIKSAAMNLSTT